MSTIQINFIHRKKTTQIEKPRRLQLQETNNHLQHEPDTEQAPEIHSCTHLNGHHSTKQSCPKTSEYIVGYNQMLKVNMKKKIRLFYKYFKDRQRISNSSQIKVTKMLLIVSTVFVLLNLPSYGLRVTIFLVVSMVKFKY